jgi:hypothetical protein
MEPKKIQYLYADITSNALSLQFDDVWLRKDKILLF